MSESCHLAHKPNRHLRYFGELGGLILGVLAAAWSVPSWSASDSPSPKIKADSQAEALAYDAADGNDAALKSLTDGAALGLPSAEYGLGTYYDLRRERFGATAETLILDRYVGQIDPDLAAFQEKVKNDAAEAGIGNSPQSLEEQQDIERAIDLWQRAALAKDPGSEAAIGSEKWAEVFRSLAMTSYVRDQGIAEPPSESSSQFALAAYQYMCTTGREMIRESITQGWPDASLQLSLYYISRPVESKDALVAASGCFESDPDEAARLQGQAAELGSPDAIEGIIRNYQGEGSSEKAAPWIARLNILVSQGNRKARKLILLPPAHPQ